MRRKLAALAVLMGLLGAVGAGTATAAPTPLVAPECAPNVSTAVLERLAELSVVVAPGQQIPYLQVRYDAVSARYVIEPCTVTVPG